MYTIFAPITGFGKAGVSIIRISGPKAKECLKYLGITPDLEPRHATLAKIYHPENKEIIDEALVTFFPAPHSFTGDDVAEIAIHGSPFIAKIIFELLGKLKNVRFAEAGEFSKIAFLNGKMDLVQSEGIADLIAAETSAQHKQALRQMQGELGKIYDDWRSELISITANIEAFIDFPDEDLPKDIIDDIEMRVANLISQIKNHLNDNKRGEKIRDGLSLAILGAPNVGKSSLINYLARSDVAIVSEIAGTTRDVIDVHLEIAGVPVIISDTAGIRQTSDSIEIEGIKRALKKSADADLKILMLDIQDLENFSLQNFAAENNLQIDENTILVINKIDLENSIFEKIKNLQIKTFPHLISLKEKTGLEDLLRALEEKVKGLASLGSSPLITRIRYREALNSAIQSLSFFSLQKNIEFAAEDLRLAIREIGKITGQVTVDNILDVVFSGFCIGK